MNLHLRLFRWLAIGAIPMGIASRTAILSGEAGPPGEMKKAGCDYS